MSQEDIREIVRLTINELAKRKMLKLENYNSMLYQVEPKLKDFFKNKKELHSILKFLPNVCSKMSL